MDEEIIDGSVVQSFSPSVEEMVEAAAAAAAAEQSRACKLACQPVGTGWQKLADRSLTPLIHQLPCGFKPASLLRAGTAAGSGAGAAAGAAATDEVVYHCMLLLAEELINRYLLIF
eukprot:gene9464-1706_t